MIALKSGLPLIGNALKPLAKSVLMSLGLTAAAADVADAAIHQKMFGFGNTTLIILNEEMNDNMELVKVLEKSSLLIKGVSQTI